MKTIPTVVRAADLAAYAPANHTGTSNVRVIGPETVGATALEVLVGTIVKSHGAKPHAHPHLEQCAYMIEGTGESEAQGRSEAGALSGIIAQRTCLQFPAQARAQIRQLGAVRGEFAGDAHVVVARTGDPFGVAGGGEQTGTDAGGVAFAAERYHRHAHPK